MSLYNLHNPDGTIERDLTAEEAATRLNVPVETLIEQSKGTNILYFERLVPIPPASHWLLLKDI